MNSVSKEQASAALQILDRLITDSEWNESSFYRAMGNKLRDIRDNLSNSISCKADNEQLASHMVNRIALRSGQQEIFVGLYSTDGTNFKTWERIIANLPGQMISRPIYAQESQVQEIIKTKEKPENEAYVSIYVNQNSFLTVSEDKVPVDKLGQTMLILKNNSINLDSIHVFVNMLKRYQYLKGRLVASIGS